MIAENYSQRWGITVNEHRQAVDEGQRSRRASTDLCNYKDTGGWEGKRERLEVSESIDGVEGEVQGQAGLLM